MPLTKDQQKRRKEIQKKREQKIKTRKKFLEDKEKEMYKEVDKKRLEDKYPPTITTMRKRAKRIDPWNTIVNYDILDAIFIVYYKLKQKGIENVKIVKNAKHGWVEFMFNENWYIVDIKAINNSKLGSPIKLKAEGEPIYTELSIYYDDINKFYDDYEDSLTLDHEEAQIEAMEDEGLNTFLTIKYF